MYQDTDAVVIPSSSCVAMIRDPYTGHIQELGTSKLREQLQSLLPRIYELSEFLINRLGVDGGQLYEDSGPHWFICNTLPLCRLRIDEGGV
jgi:L-lactate dehydrogenase complex protein LldE